MRGPVNKSLVNHAGKEIGFVRKIAGRKDSVKIPVVRHHVIVVAQVRLKSWRRSAGRSVRQQQSRTVKSRGVRISGTDKMSFPVRRRSRGKSGKLLIQKAHFTAAVDCQCRTDRIGN